MLKSTDIDYPFDVGPICKNRAAVEETHPITNFDLKSDELNCGPLKIKLTVKE